MSNTNGNGNRSELDEIRSLSQQFSRELEGKDIHVHGAVVQAMNNYLQFRAVEMAKKEKEAELAAKLETDRQARFGLNPPTPISH